MPRTFALLVAAILTITYAVAQPKQLTDLKKDNAPVVTTVIKVPTIVCGSCVTNVSNAVKKVVGVKSAKVDLKKKTATVTYASNKVTLDKIEKAIADAGYDANNVKRNPAAYEKLDACCKSDDKKH